jgi:hypothetical protein
MFSITLDDVVLVGVVRPACATVRLACERFDSDVAYGTPVPLNLAVAGRQREDGMSPAFQ